MKNTSSFSDFFSLALSWEDKSKYGSHVSGQLARFIISRLYPRSYKYLSSRKIDCSPQKISTLNNVVLSERSSKIYKRTIADSKFWHIDAQKVKPTGLGIKIENSNATSFFDFSSTSLATINRWLSDRNPDFNFPEIEFLFSKISGAVKKWGFRRDAIKLKSQTHMPTFIGHACMTWFDGTYRLWTDPYFFPKSMKYPKFHQPLSPLDFPDAKHIVLISHSHSDHFHLSSLLRLPQDTCFIIPDCKRETPISIDMAFRLRQLGFIKITKLKWWQQISCGEFSITAAPFIGEQPLSSGKKSDLKDFNIGNVYCITHKKKRFLLMADSASDTRRHCLSLAHEIRSRMGPIDYLLGNRINWRLFPVQYLTSPIPQFLCYVPNHCLNVLQEPVMTPDDLSTIASIVEAKFIVPYAMGGAKWHADAAIGLDYFESNRSFPKGHPLSFDLQRSSIQQQLLENWNPLVLRPGQFIDSSGRVKWIKGHSSF